MQIHINDIAQTAYSHENPDRSCHVLAQTFPVSYLE